ncbi:MAG: hypothetical protein GY920_05590 [Aliivibrio sp.]|nr:hypothetical protein [Aliivibrio sp.]
MAKISNTLSYPNQSPIEAEDYLIGTAANSTPIERQTKTFTLGGIAEFVIDEAFDGCSFRIPVFTAATAGEESFKLVNSIIYQDTAAESEKTPCDVSQGSTIYIDNGNGAGNLFVAGDTTTNGLLTVDGGIYLNSEVYDAFNNVGTGEQVLVSQADGTVQWQNYQGSGLEFQGAWDADMNNPDLTAVPLIPANTGKYWIVSVAGGTNLPTQGGGSIYDWEVGDWAIISEDLNDNIFWDKIDNSSVLTGGGTKDRFAIWTSPSELGDGDILRGNGDYSLIFNDMLTSDASGNYANAFGVKTLAEGDFSFATGQENRALGKTSFVTGFSNEADGDGSAAFGNTTRAGGTNSFVGGDGSNADGNNAFSFGGQTQASGDFSVAMGASSNTTGDFSVVLGQGNSVAANHGVAIGYGNYVTPTGLFSFAMGFESTASGALAIAIGNNAVASGESSLAIGGENAIASGDYSFATGQNTTASGEYSVAMGEGATASGVTSTAMGGATTASNGHCVAMGKASTASGNVSFAMGSQTQAIGDASTAMGDLTTASGNVSTAMGSGSTASGDNSLAIGVSAQSTGNTSIAMGNGSEASGNYSVSIGQNTEASGTISLAMGNGSEASNTVSVAIGNRVEASGPGAVALGQDTISTGGSSTAMGSGTLASGNVSTAMGDDTEASGAASTAMGGGTTASGSFSVAAGKSSQATGNVSVAIGDANVASGFYAQAYGKDAEASGDNSFAFGTVSTTTADGVGSFSFGDGNESKADGSFTMGTLNIADGASSFTIGKGNQTNGTASQSFSIGKANQNAGEESYTIGTSLNATDFRQIVIGSNNVPLPGSVNTWSANDNLVTIGNGENSSNQSNALEIKKGGQYRLPTYGSGNVIGNDVYNLSVDSAGNVIETQRVENKYIINGMVNNLGSQAAGHDFMEWTSSVTPSSTQIPLWRVPLSLKLEAVTWVWMGDSTVSVPVGTDIKFSIGKVANNTNAQFSNYTPIADIFVIDNSDNGTYVSGQVDLSASLITVGQFENIAVVGEETGALTPNSGELAISFVFKEIQSPTPPTPGPGETTICNYVWTDENSSITDTTSGGTIPIAANATEFYAQHNAGLPVAAYWDFDSNNSERGLLYNQFAAREIQPPTGFRLPTDIEWNVIRNVPCNPSFPNQNRYGANPGTWTGLTDTTELGDADFNLNGYGYASLATNQVFFLGDTTQEWCWTSTISSTGSQGNTMKAWSVSPQDNFLIVATDTVNASTRLSYIRFLKDV